ncbi:MAG: PAS domain-containing protein [Geminicoccaceae bacterium]
MQRSTLATEGAGEASDPLLGFLAGGSEMAELIRRHDWNGSLGSVPGWPASLRTAVGLMLHSPVPLVLLWGADGIMLYNDAYGEFAGNRHPGLLGSKVLEGWPEAAELNRHVMRVGMSGGSLQYKDAELVLNRRGAPERCWLDLFYSPVIDESGRPGGVIAVVVETTERVLARQNAVAQHEHLSQLFQDAPGFMAQLDGPEHVFTFANAAYQRLIAHRQVIGRTVVEALPEIVGQGFVELLDQVYRTGEHFRGHAVPVTVQRTPDAAPEERLLDFIYQPMRDSAGRVAGIFVEGTDVTDSERAAAAVRDNEARLRFLDALGTETAKSQDADAILAISTRMVGEHLGVAVCAYADMDADQDGFTIRGDWSAPGSATIVGRYRLADFGAKAVKALGTGRPLIVDDIARELAPSDAAAFHALGIAATIVVPLVKADRLTALMAIHRAAPHAWSRSELALIREVADRSWAHVERVRDEAARRDAAERLRLAANAAQIGTFDYNPISGELRWDERCKALFGLPPDAEVSYETFLAGLHPDDRAWTDQAVQRALAAEGSGSFDVEYRTIGLEDGVERWIAATGSAFFDDRAPVRFVGTVLDISAQKRAEIALADINATLEQRVAERTSQLQLAEEALRQAQKMEAVGQLTGGIAHDFNNLLQGITGAIERAQQRIASDRSGEADRYLRAAMDAASRAAGLTHRLLAFSRRQPLDPRPADVNQLIGGMEELVSRTMGPSIAVEVELAAGLWPVLVDCSQLENSLLNLCINARDAMPEGGTLSIATANRRVDEHEAQELAIPAGPYVELAVTDTGTGMVPAVIARAFDPFFTTKPLGRGTGLGLSMTYGFARQSGGQIHIRSQVGEGTTMCLYFPRFVGEPERLADPASERVDRGFGETVLVVDDDATVRMLIAEVLSENHYRILEAEDGVAALELLAGEQAVHLMVTDVGLPGIINGRQIADAARIGRPQLKVLFITGFAENAVVRSGQLEPGMALLAKPFAMSTLANKVREMLES